MRKLSLLSILVVTAVIATACLGRRTPTSTPQPQEPQSAPTATPQPETESQPTSTPLPPTPTQPPEPTTEPTPASAQEETLPDSEAVTSAARAADITGPTIVGIVWQWVELDEPSGPSVVADPENYALVFHTDRTFNVKADCNAGHGTYTLEDNRLSLGPIATTKVLCPKGSRSDQFVDLLESADTIKTRDGKLIIALEGEAGNMAFYDAGTPKMPPRPNPKARIVRVVWQWVEIHEPDGQSVVPHPEKFLLILQPDGTFNITADCNAGSGTYTLDGDRLTLDVTAITEAYCGDESLFDLFITMLDAVDTVSVDEPTRVGVGPARGRLVLTLKDGTGKMVFDRAGMAKVPVQPCDWMIDILWMWERFDDPADRSDIVVVDPSKYTLHLLPDGTFRFKADCNAGTGTYTTCDGSRFTLELGASTLAECGPDSLYDEYLGALGDVASYAMDEGKLVLNLEADAGNMVFGREDKAAPEAWIDLDTITLDTTGLPGSWQAVLVPATPYDDSQPAGPRGLPEHVQINVGEAPSEAAGAPVIYIIPIEAYRQLWEGNADPGVSIILEALQVMLQEQPESFPTAGIPVLPFEELTGTNDLAVHGMYADLGTVHGLRFVGRFAQSPTLVINEGLGYIFQGFAGDADQYLVAFFYPVTTTVLPDSDADAPAGEQDRLNEDPEAYLQERAATLDGLSEEDWAPDLYILDAVIASLSFGATP
jgi:heat shock protein HslJ